MTPPLFSVLANQLIGPITKKGFFAGEYVHFGQFLMACQYLFETGVTAAEVFSDRLLVFVKLFSDAGAEERCLQYLRECATKRMAAAGDACRSFLQIFLFTELREAGLPRDWTGADLVRVTDRKIQKKLIENSLLKMQFHGAEGVGFGSAYPELSRELLKESAEPLDAVEWSKLRGAGLDIPQKPPQGTLSEQKETVRGLVSAYVSQFRPELLEPLGLHN
jgi:hypothetical protein